MWNSATGPYFLWRNLSQVLEFNITHKYYFPNIGRGWWKLKFHIIITSLLSLKVGGKIQIKFS